MSSCLPSQTHTCELTHIKSFFQKKYLDLWSSKSEQCQSLQVAQWIAPELKCPDTIVFLTLPVGQITLGLGECTHYNQKQYNIFSKQQYILISLLAHWLLLIADLLWGKKREGGFLFFISVSDVECCNLSEI